MQFQNVFSRPNRSINGCDTGQKPKIRRHHPSVIVSRQSWPCGKSRDLIRHRKYQIRLIKVGSIRLTDIILNYPCMRIVDHACFGWESDVGSPISRGLFAAAQIRTRVPLVADLLWGDKKFRWKSDERLDHNSRRYFGGNSD